MLHRQQKQYDSSSIINRNGTTAPPSTETATAPSTGTVTAPSTGTVRQHHHQQQQHDSTTINRNSNCTINRNNNSNSTINRNSTTAPSTGTAPGAVSLVPDLILACLYKRTRGRSPSPSAHSLEAPEGGDEASCSETENEKMCTQERRVKKLLSNVG
ncbi:hypothetical protein FHG87_015692 [Trinorchestia longiramus]|nr:hypothetical protein FHG87_015692 [Trinorchestia longiramus]